MLPLRIRKMPISKSGTKGAAQVCPPIIFSSEGKPGFRARLLADLARLITLHALSPVRLSVEELAQHAARAVLPSQVQLHSFPVWCNDKALSLYHLPRSGITDVQSANYTHLPVPSRRRG